MAVAGGGVGGKCAVRAFCGSARLAAPARSPPRAASRSLAARGGKSGRTAAQAKGDALERRVARLLRLRGWPTVDISVRIKSPAGHWSEIDVVAKRYFGLQTLYVECKNYSQSVELQHVAKFAEVLRQNNIPLSRGLFVTTSRLTPRARRTGVTTWDGVELRRMEAIARRWRLLRSTALSTIVLFLASFGLLLSYPSLRPFLPLPPLASDDDDLLAPPDSSSPSSLTTSFHWLWPQDAEDDEVPSADTDLVTRLDRSALWANRALLEAIASLPLPKQ